MTTKTTVKSVTDGDTFVGSGDISYRLEGVDTPERGYPRYEEARQYLKSLIDGKTVEVDVKARDRYGRSVAQVRYNGVNINKKVKEKFG